MSDRKPPRTTIREVRSFRLGDDLVARLDDYAALTGLTRNTVAERLLDEALRQVQHPGIVFRDGPAGRRAAVAGGPDVWEIVMVLRHADGDVPGTAAHLGLAESTIRTATRYYAAFQAEVDAWIQDNEEFAEREMALAERQRSLFQ